MSICLIMHHAIKVHREVEVSLHAFLTPALKGSDQFHEPAVLPAKKSPRYPLHGRLITPILQYRDTDFRVVHKTLLKRLMSKARYEISAAVMLRVLIFWDVTLCST